MNPQKIENCLKNKIDFDFYKILFEQVRLEILLFLVANGKKNITEISENFKQDRSVISRHLDIMNKYHILDKEKENRNTYYQAKSDFVVAKFETTLSMMKIMLNNDCK